MGEFKKTFESKDLISMFCHCNNVEALVTSHGKVTVNQIFDCPILSNMYAINYSNCMVLFQVLFVSKKYNLVKVVPCSSH